MEMNNCDQANGPTTESGSATSGAVDHKLLPTAGAPFAVINSAGVLVTIVLGGMATLYADLFPASTLGQLQLAMAAGWVVCMLLVLLILGYHEKSSSGLPWVRMWWATKMLRANPGYAFMVLFMAAAAAFCIFGKLGKESGGGGVLKSLVMSAERAERISLETKELASRAAISAEATGYKADALIVQGDRIEKKLGEPLTPRQVLAKQGVSWDGPSLTQALVGSDVQVVKLFIDGGMNAEMAAAPQGQGGGNALGQFVVLSLARDREATVQIVRILASKMDLSEPVARFRGMPPLNFVSLAAYSCNAPMARALAAAGVNMKRLNRVTLPQLGMVVTYDPLEKLEKWQQRYAIDDRPCPEADRQELLRIVRAGTFQ